MGSRIIGVVTALTLIATASATHANPAEVFGFGSRHAGRAGAVSATVNDFAAGYYNPAGLGFGEGKRVSFGFVGAFSNLRIQDERIDISEPLGMVFGASTPAPLGGPLKDRIYVGLGLYLLPGTAAQVKARLPEEPFYPYYDNRTQRAVVLPTVAVRPIKDLSVGVAVNFLATLAGKVSASEGATRALDARVDEEIPAIARLNAGVTWRPSQVPGLSVAAVFRQRFEIPFATDAKTNVAGEPINLDISASGQFTPTQIVAGVAWTVPRFDVALDLTWADWSAYPGPFVQVRSELPLVGPLAGELPDVPYKDTLGVRLGGEVRLPRGAGHYALRGGWGLETSPIPDRQSGVTNLLDGLKNTVSAGAGIYIPNAIGKHPLRIDVHAQAQLVSRRTITKTIVADPDEFVPFDNLRDEVEDDPGDPDTAGIQISNPGYPNLQSGGEVYSAGLTMEVGF